MKFKHLMKSSGPALAMAAVSATLGPQSQGTESSMNADISTVTYCDDRKMDIYSPINASSAMPAAIYVHGGGWTEGGRRKIWPEAVSQSVMDALLERGFLITSIDYALNKSYPQNIRDVVCSIQYLRANAESLHISPEHIGIWGDSAGGHLAALAALADEKGAFDSPKFPGVSSQVQAVIDLYGPSMMATNVFGTAQANPISWISDKSDSDPPFLIIHGKADRTVPVSDSQALYDALKAAGQPVTLQIVEGADHGFFPNDATINPSDGQIIAMMTEFFIQHLGAKNPG